MNYLGFFVSIFAVLSLSGCANQIVESAPVQEDLSVAVVKNQTIIVEMPLQIATWSSTKTDGRFTAMGLGYLTKFNNCLTLTMNAKELPTKDNTLLLVLADTSFSWDAAKEILFFEGKSYKIGDELYLGGTAFVYPNPNITDQVKVNWIECGLDKGWLGG